MLTASIFNAYDMYISNHNPIITYFNASLLSDAIKFARARQLGHNTRRIFKYDSISTDQWSAFAVELDNLCPVDPFGLSNKAANSTLPSVTVSNTYIPKKSKDLESTQCESGGLRTEEELLAVLES
ncbi:hypothetical protein RIR_jg20092.t1 [Rhizophagus irregularis DAOM 181602=DAOM 197198]|nr:hypothetical protein RIR_jg20092.t1 [Rhizophagus irregularis DAOM 181602=DAOM 197198]